jgi:hypothetical protein
MLARIAQQDHKLPGFRAQQWFFFFVATFYLYFRWVGWDRHLSKDAGCRRSRSQGVGVGPWAAGRKTLQAAVQLSR